MGQAATAGEEAFSLTYTTSPIMAGGEGAVRPMLRQR